MKHVNTITLQGSIEQMRTRIAIEQGAMHQVQLSVARWRGGDAGSKPEHGQASEADEEPGPGPGPAMAASQTEWHAAAQCHFLCWLAGGGFAQACAEAEVPTQAGPADAPREAGNGKADGQILPAACRQSNCTA